MRRSLLLSAFILGASGASCDIDGCFDRCKAKYDGSWDDDGSDGYYCSKGCVKVNGGEITDEDFFCDVEESKRFSFCTDSCSTASSHDEKNEICRYGCGFWNSSPTPTPSPSPSPTPTPTPPSGKFVHPGVLVTEAMLLKVRKHVSAGDAMWLAAMDETHFKGNTDLSAKPQPQEKVDCGYDDKPDHGCTEETEDVKRAYAHALKWAVTEDEAHAQKAIEIMDAWSAVMKKHTNKNARLQAGWCGSPFTRAAEIIKYMYGNWPNADRFGKMLTEAYLPTVQENADEANGNWDLIMTETAMSIAVFTENEDAWNKAVDRWKHRAPRYLYLESDGKKPKGYNKDRWHGLDKFKDGVCQETCRDFQHTQYGIMAMINAAETAWHQGLDLYGKESDRLVAGLEFHANYINDGDFRSDKYCHGKKVKVKTDPTWEVAYNHFHGRRGEELKYTADVLQTIRPTGAKRHMEFETLTHYAQDYEPDSSLLFA